jgi:general secretion pathway protein L
MSLMVLFTGEEPMPWLRIEEGVVAERGEGIPASEHPLIAVIPADRVSWHIFDLTALSHAQGLVAARLDASESSLGDPLDRHVAVNADRNGYVVTSRTGLRTLLAELAKNDLEVTAVVPSPALLSLPEDGYVRGAMPNETVLRSASGGLRDDGELSALVLGDAPVRTLTPEELEDSIAQAAVRPDINLLQGEFAPRTQWVADTGYWTRMARYAAIGLALTLAIPVAKWAKLTASTSALEGQSAQVAARALGEAAASPDAARRLRTRLAERRGGGAGFVATEAVLARAVEMQPNAELGMLGFEPDGAMRATVRGTSQADLDTVRAALAAAGFAVDVSGQTNNQGPLQAEFTVRPR